MGSRALVLSASLGLAFLALSAAGELRTIVLRTVDDTDTISFDSSKISEAQLRELILLSPFVVEYVNDVPGKDLFAAGSIQGSTPDKQFVALALEMCIAANPAYAHCEEHHVGTPYFLRNGRLNIQKSKRGLAWLQHLNHPSQLDAVVSFLEERLSISIWIEETKVKYYSTWDERSLMEVRRDIDPAKRCGDVFAMLRDAKSSERRYEIVRSDWTNCILRITNQQLGSYPVKEWNAFLAAYSIKENYQQIGPPD